MERKTFERSPCSIARSLDVLGDWWNPLILRECLYGNARFDELQRWLGISRNILTRRLNGLVEQELLIKSEYQSNPQRYEYLLTDKGYDACVVLLALMPFGEKWYFDKNREPIVLYDKKTGKVVTPMVIDKHTGEALDPSVVVPGPGPGFKAPKSITQDRFSGYYDSGFDND